MELKRLERETGLTFHPELDRSTVGNLCVNNGCHLQNYKFVRNINNRYWEHVLLQGISAILLEEATIIALEFAQPGERLG